jgi:hypothetical protein
MASKYEKYILREPTAKWGDVEAEPDRSKRKSIRINTNLEKSVGIDMAFMGVSAELIKSMPDKPGHPSHVHDVDEYLLFMGSDPTNILEFGAEVELTLGAGEDKEVHTIDSVTIVYIPAGLAHLPMVYKRVDKPIYFGHLLLSPDYVETRL